MRKQKNYKCSFCSGKVYKNFGAWASHMELMHGDQIPKEWSPARYLYFMQTGMREGKCIVCKNPTAWNEKTQKYERYCKNPACKQAYVKTAKKRMVDKYGKEYILTDPDVQRKMQASKKISGKYKFQDGGSIEYVGSYEKDFLEMLDSFGFSSNDIIGPSPNTYFYTYDNPKEPDKKGKHFYIPDFFIPSLKLEIEIKTQLNTHHKIQDIDKVKEAQKDEMMNRLSEKGKINYLKLSDKDYVSFFQFLLDMRELDTKEDLQKQVKTIDDIASEEYVDLKTLELDIGIDQFLPDTDDFIEIPIDDIAVQTYANIFPNLEKMLMQEPYKTAIIKNAYFGNYIGFYCFNTDTKELVSLEVLPEFKNLGYEMAMRNYIADKYKIKFDSPATEGNNRITYTDEGHDTIINLTPDEKPFGIDRFLKVFNLEFFVISDTHIMTYDEANRVRLHSIIKNINDTVGENDHLLFLGDLGGKRGYESLEDTKNFIKEIKCKNIYLVLGNHDMYSIEDYKKMGFLMVTDRVTWKNILFSHVPERVKDGMINIHGHNHGTETYINDGVSADDHIDVYNEMFIPSRVRDLINKERNPERISDNFGIDVKPQIETSIPEVDAATEEAFEQLQDFFTEFNSYYEEHAPEDELEIAEEALSLEPGHYPIYIVLMHTNGSLMSKLTKFATGDEWTHANISFNIKLDPMYTMGSKSPGSEGPLVGFNICNQFNDFFRDGIRAKYGVYYMEVDKAAYKKIKKRVEFFLSKKDYFRYDWKGVVKCFFKLPTKENKRWFCSSLVANIIGAGVDLPMNPSLYKPQDLTKIYDKIYLIDKGDDFYKYDWKIAKKNLLKLKETINMKSINDSSVHLTGVPDEPMVQARFALEAFSTTDKVEAYKGFWKERLFSPDAASNLVGRRDMPMPSKYITPKKIVIDEKRKVISIQHINHVMLLNRITETYGEQKLEYIFNLMYTPKDVALFRNKRTTRSAMKIVAIESPLFFAMELNILFTELAEKYRYHVYKAIARVIYEKTWLSKADAAEVKPISLAPLNKLNPAFTLKDHQMQFIQMYPRLKARLNLNGYILAFDQGLGKTLTATALSLCLESDQVFIICPNSLKSVWRQEIGNYIQKYKDNPKLADKEIVICTKDSKVDFKSAKFIITNNEAISLMYKYTGYSTNAMMIVDEMHNFRNLTGQRSDELFEVKQKIRPKDILLMSGTPIKASPSELVPSLKLIDTLFTDDAATIYNRCFNLKDTMAMSIVRKRFGYIMYRKTKEILDLPTKTIQDMKLPIADPTPYYMDNINSMVVELFSEYYSEELSRNEEYQKEFVKLVEYYSSASSVDTNKYIHWIIKTVNTERTMNMHEIDKMFIDTFLDTYVRPNIKKPEQMKRIKELEGKFIHMEQSCFSRAIGKIYPPKRSEVYTALFRENEQTFVDAILGRTKKTVIFSQFLNVIHNISDRLTALGIKNVKVVGGTGNRMELIDQFKHDDETMVLLATSQTLGTGVTLIEADQMFFFGPPWRSTDFDQCCDRIYRIGQTSDVIIFNVVLDSEQFNLTDRMNKILNWSGDMFGAAINEAQLDGSMESMSSLLEFDNDPEVDGLIGYHMDLLSAKNTCGYNGVEEILPYHPEYLE